MRGRRNIGLCIGSRETVIAEVSMNAEGEVEIGQLNVMETPDSDFYQGRITDPASIARTVRELLGQADMSGTKELALTISDEGVITRMQTLPFMSRNETVEALVGEVENYAIMAGGEPAIDYQLASDTGEASGQAELLFIATPRESLDSYLSSMETINLKLSSMETISLAALRAIKYLSRQQSEEDNLPQFENDKPVMIVTIEENVGMLIILNGRNIQFVHNMESGAKNLRGDMDFRKNEMAREISSSADYYHNTFPDSGQIESAVLLFDGSDTIDFREILENHLNIPVIAPRVPVSAEENVEEKIADNSLSVYAAVGAAMRACVKDDSSINLLASSRRRTAGAGLRNRMILLLVVIVSAILLAVSGRVYCERKADAVEQDLISLRMNQAVSEAEASAQIPVIQAGIDSLTMQLEATDTAMNSIQWLNIVRMFEEIRAIIPNSVWLIRLSWSSGNVSFEGFGLDWDAVAKFRDVLLDSPYFDPVNVRSETLVEIGGESTIRFLIQCGVKLPT